MNEEVKKEVREYVTAQMDVSISQKDKVFVRNELGKHADSDDFNLAVVAWKKKGGGKVEWNFVMEMTDLDLVKELGIDNDTLKDKFNLTDEDIAELGKE